MKKNIKSITAALLALSLLLTTYMTVSASDNTIKCPCIVYVEHNLFKAKDFSVRIVFSANFTDYCNENSSITLYKQNSDESWKFVEKYTAKYGGNSGTGINAAKYKDKPDERVGKKYLNMAPKDFILGDYMLTFSPNKSGSLAYGHYKFVIQAGTVVTEDGMVNQETSIEFTLEKITLPQIWSEEWPYMVKTGIAGLAVTMGYYIIMFAGILSIL